MQFIADDGRGGPVRFLRVNPNAPDNISKMAKRLSEHGELDFCYEADGCGYNLDAARGQDHHGQDRSERNRPSLLPSRLRRQSRTSPASGSRRTVVTRGSWRFCLVRLLDAGSVCQTRVCVTDARGCQPRRTEHRATGSGMSVCDSHLVRTRQQRLAFVLRYAPSVSDRQSFDEVPSVLTGRAAFSLPLSPSCSGIRETGWTADERQNAQIKRTDSS